MIQRGKKNYSLMCITRKNVLINDIFAQLAIRRIPPTVQHPGLKYSFDREVHNKLDVKINIDV